MGKVFLFSQNQNYLIGVDNKNRIKSWNKSSFNNYSNINEFNKTIKSIALLENNLLAIASCDMNGIEIWDVKNQSKSFDLNDHTDCVNTVISLNFFDQTFLISGSADTTIRLYDSYFKNIQTIQENSDPVLTLEYNPQNKLIASNSKSNKIKIWSFSYNMNERKKAHDNGINTICVLGNGLIATGSQDAKAKIWKINNDNSLKLVSTLERLSDWVNSLILLKNKSLVSGSFLDGIKVWIQKNEYNFKCVATLN